MYLLSYCKLFSPRDLFSYHHNKYIINNKIYNKYIILTFTGDMAVAVAIKTT